MILWILDFALQSMFWMGLAWLATRARRSMPVQTRERDVTW
jgi:hypothetical protein